MTKQELIEEKVRKFEERFGDSGPFAGRTLNEAYVALSNYFNANMIEAFNNGYKQFAEDYFNGKLTVSINISKKEEEPITNLD